MIPNAGDAVWYGYAGKSRTMGKSILPNAGNAVRYAYVGKAGATRKTTKVGNAVWYSVTVF